MPTKILILLNINLGIKLNKLRLPLQRIISHHKHEV